MSMPMRCRGLVCSSRLCTSNLRSVCQATPKISQPTSKMPSPTHSAVSTTVFVFLSRNSLLVCCPLQAQRQCCGRQWWSKDICSRTRQSIRDWIKWILNGALHLCPPCNNSFHLAKISNSNAKQLSKVFEVYNECLRDKWKQFCCFVCGKLFPLEESSHTVHTAHCSTYSRKHIAIQSCLFERPHGIHGLLTSKIPD